MKNIITAYRMVMENEEENQEVGNDKKSEKLDVEVTFDNDSDDVVILIGIDYRDDVEIKTVIGIYNDKDELEKARTRLTAKYDKVVMTDKVSLNDAFEKTLDDLIGG